MKVAIVQMAVEQGEFEKNIAKTEAFAKRAHECGADIAVFPEMFLCGFNYKKNLDYLRANGDAAQAALCNIALKYGIAICGSIPFLNPSLKQPTNRLVFVNADGTILSHYDKIHLFSIFNENSYVAAGNQIVVSDTPLGRCGFAICYDLRFPDMFVEMTKRNAKMIIICAAFPNPRSEHWRILSRARAIENQCFVIAVNQCGHEDFANNKVKYFGASAVIDPWGGVVAECEPDAEDAMAFADINLDEVEDIRAKIPALADRRDDLY